MKNAYKKIPVSDDSSVGHVRRTAVALGKSVGLTCDALGRLSIAVTEASTNILQHAGVGEVLISAWEDSNNACIAFFAIDKGPGMRNVAKCLQDGYSTGGSRGVGLGAIDRLSDFFDIYAMPDKGCIIYATFSNQLSSSPEVSAVNGISVAKPGERSCGDAWDCIERKQNLARLILVDGLGHGEQAARSAEQIICNLNSVSASLKDSILHAHHSVNGLRGGVVAMAQIDVAAGSLTFCGVGNLSGTVWERDKKVTGLVSHDGTLGESVHTLREYMYPFSSQSILILHTDGLKSGWDLSDYPGITMKSSSLIAAILYRDFAHGRDDAGVLVYKPLEDC